MSKRALIIAGATAGITMAVLLAITRAFFEYDPVNDGLAGLFAIISGYIAAWWNEAEHGNRD